MRKEECVFSGFPIHPGHGKRFVATNFISTKPVLPFHSRRCGVLYDEKKNPRYVSWTKSYRKNNKKGQTDQDNLKRRKRALSNLKKQGSASVRGFHGADAESLRVMKHSVHQAHSAAGAQDKSAAAAAARSEMKARKDLKKGKAAK
ncbi:ribosomal protein L24 [Perkinsela sp. CCAP 1560/4]|nr:ribosomal protein L24 [Perkinsela sp. CCAP 1560/4]|eukprot:KNH06482.1 ribosomal protein L24 [Perkinsela sp. CCAP 1560/4]